jgi:hydroxyacylglutathione hydrolase
MTTPPAANPIPLALRRCTLGPFQTNAYVLRPEGHEGCWIIDAPFDPEPLIAAVHALGGRPEALILTHAHVDHIAGIPAVRRAFPGLPVLIHRAEAAWLNDPLLNLSAHGGQEIAVGEADRLLDGHETLTLGPTRWRVLQTPGHSPGSISLFCAEANLAIVGDALFAGSVGRSDFPGSDPDVLADSIRRQLYTLPGITKVLPGHGPATTIGREAMSNPFVRAVNA